MVFYLFCCCYYTRYQGELFYQTDTTFNHKVVGSIFVLLVLKVIHLYTKDCYIQTQAYFVFAFNIFSTGYTTFIFSKKKITYYFFASHLCVHIPYFAPLGSYQSPMGRTGFSPTCQAICTSEHTVHIHFYQANWRMSSPYNVPYYMKSF